MFALDQKLDAVALKSTDILICQSAEDKTLAQRIAQALRRQGCSVARDMIKRDLEQSIDYATKMNYKFVMIIGQDSETVTLRYLHNGSEHTVAIEEILAGRFNVQP